MKFNVLLQLSIERNTDSHAPVNNSYICKTILLTTNTYTIHDINVLLGKRMYDVEFNIYR